MDRLDRWLVSLWLLVFAGVVLAAAWNWERLPEAIAYFVRNG